MTWELFVISVLGLVILTLEGCAVQNRKEAFIGGCLIGGKVMYNAVAEEPWLEDWNLTWNVVCEEYEVVQKMHY